METFDPEQLTPQQRSVYEELDAQERLLFEAVSSGNVNEAANILIHAGSENTVFETFLNWSEQGIIDDTIVDQIASRIEHLDNIQQIISSLPEEQQFMAGQLFAGVVTEEAAQLAMNDIDFARNLQEWQQSGYISQQSIDAINDQAIALRAAQPQSALHSGILAEPEEQSAQPERYQPRNITIPTDIPEEFHSAYRSAYQGIISQNVLEAAYQSPEFLSYVNNMMESGQIRSDNAEAFRVQFQEYSSTLDTIESTPALSEFIQTGTISDTLINLMENEQMGNVLLHAIDLGLVPNDARLDNLAATLEAQSPATATITEPLSSTQENNTVAQPLDNPQAVITSVLSAIPADATINDIHANLTEALNEAGFNARDIIGRRPQLDETTFTQTIAVTINNAEFVIDSSLRDSQGNILLAPAGASTMRLTQETLNDIIAQSSVMQTVETKTPQELFAGCVEYSNALVEEIRTALVERGFTYEEAANTVNMIHFEREGGGRHYVVSITPPDMEPIIVDPTLAQFGGTEPFVGTAQSYPQALANTLGVSPEQLPYNLSAIAPAASDTNTPTPPAAAVETVPGEAVFGTVVPGATFTAPAPEEDTQEQPPSGNVMQSVTQAPSNPRDGIFQQPPPDRSLEPQTRPQPQPREEFDPNPPPQEPVELPDMNPQPNPTPQDLEGGNSGVPGLWTFPPASERDRVTATPKPQENTADQRQQQFSAIQSRFESLTQSGQMTFEIFNETAETLQREGYASSAAEAYQQLAGLYDNAMRSINVNEVNGVNEPIRAALRVIEQANSTIELQTGVRSYIAQPPQLEVMAYMQNLPESARTFGAYSELIGLNNGRYELNQDKEEAIQNGTNLLGVPAPMNVSQAVQQFNTVQLQYVRPAITEYNQDNSSLLQTWSPQNVRGYNQNLENFREWADQQNISTPDINALDSRSYQAMQPLETPAITVQLSQLQNGGTAQVNQVLNYIQSVRSTELENQQIERQNPQIAVNNHNTSLLFEASHNQATAIMENRAQEAARAQLIAQQQAEQQAEQQRSYETFRASANAIGNVNLGANTVQITPEQLSRVEANLPADQREANRSVFDQLRSFADGAHHFFFETDTGRIIVIGGVAAGAFVLSGANPVVAGTAASATAAVIMVGPGMQQELQRQNGAELIQSQNIESEQQMAQQLSPQHQELIQDINLAALGVQGGTTIDTTPTYQATANIMQPESHMGIV